MFLCAHFFCAETSSYLFEAHGGDPMFREFPLARVEGERWFEGH